MHPAPSEHPAGPTLLEPIGVEYRAGVTHPVATGGAGPAPPFCFVHAADLHLDSPFRGVTAQDRAVAQALRRATFDAFEALVRLCIDRRADFLLIAGDVFDAADRSLRAQLFFFDGLKRLADQGIPSFVVHGNHDPLEGWSPSVERPPLVTVFGAGGVETVPVTVAGRTVAAVSGISYQRRQESRDLAALFPGSPPGLFRIGLLHANCGGNPRYESYAPCSVEELGRAGIDYWALGHVHEHAVLRRDPLVVYPGSTQGLSIREPGPRGCCLVRVDAERRAELEFCPLDAVRWEGGEITIAGLDSLSGLDRALATLLGRLRDQAAGRPVISRIGLVGRGPLYAELTHGNTVADLLERARQAGLAEEPFVWIQELEMAGRPEADLEQRRRIDDLLGRVLQIAASLREPDPGADSPPPPLEQSLGPVLADLFENPRAEKMLDRLTPQELQRLLEQAELLCLDLLESG